MRVLDIWMPSRLEDVMRSGRTHPLVLACLPVSPDGGTLGTEERLMVVKGPGLPEVTERSLFCEAFGNLLARELGINTAEPGLVRWEEDFVAALNPVLTRESIQIRSGMAVGAEYVRGGLASVVPGAFRSAEETVQASRIYGFDLLAQNPDRRPEKPNCASYKGGFLAYDFELAFSFLLALPGPEQPWEVSRIGIASRHLFHAQLRTAEINWDAFLAAVGRLSDKHLTNLRQGLPENWQPWGMRVQSHLLAIAAHPAEFKLELARSLT